MTVPKSSVCLHMERGVRRVVSCCSAGTFVQPCPAEGGRPQGSLDSDRLLVNSTESG